MLPVETSSYVEENMASAHPDQKISPSSVSNAILLKSPKYAMHPPQHPSTDKHQQQKKPIHPSTFSHLHANSSTSATVSVTSQEYYSSQNNSSHSKNSTASAGSNDGSGDNNSKSSSNGNIVVSSFSNLATQSIGQGKYRQALEYYQLALQDYLKEKTTVVELVNAAATCFNLGALAKKLHEYPQAADYFDQAQHMYERSRTLVEKHIQTTRGNTHLLVATESVLKSTSSISSSSCQVCLLQLIVETLHARAHLHYKYQSLVNDAIECHEQVIELLEDSSQSVRYDDIYYCRIQFTVISQQWRWQFLCTSLQALGKFYVEKGEIEDAIIAYQDTLSILKKLNNFSIESNEQRQQEILQILRALSDIFMQSNIKCTDVKKLEQSALLQENINDWDKAMQCWERVVYCQSKEYGEESFEVSLALAQVGRVMVLEGNLEGGLDLYHAAANISFKNQKDVTFMPEHIFLGVLNLYNELDRNPDAISWLKSLISVQCVRREDTARIQLELGKLYLIQGLLHAASDSLSLSLELFDEEDNSAFEYLKKVKALQNQNDTDNYGEKFQDDATFDTPNNNDDACVTASRLTAITEDGESALASVSTILNEDNNIVANDKIMPDDSEEVFDDSICTDPNALDNETDQSIFAKTEENQNKVNSGAAKETTNTTREVREHEINTVEELLPSDEDTSSSTDDPLNKNGINSNQSEIPDLETSNSHFEGSDSIRSINNDPKDNGVNNPFHLDIRPRIDEDDDVLTQQNIISGEYDVTPTTLITETSRTGLLNHVEKDTSLISLTIPRISSSSPKHSKTKDRKGYTEIKMLEKHSGSIGKRRIVKALASSFRRSRSKSRSVPGNLLGPVDEEKAVYPSTPVDKTRKAENDNVSLQSTNAPVSFIDLLSISDDESLVSQLTFKQEELLSKRKEPNSHWWWGVTVEGLSYVNQAVEAAEGWLSAKAIHESVKSPPLDFDSDDESDCVGEDFSLLKDASLNHAVTKKFTNEALVNNKLPKSVNISSQLGKSSVESSAVKDTINSSNSGSYKTPSLECQIKEKELVLKGKKIEDGSDDVSVAAVLFDLAGLYKKKKEFTNAMMYYRKAYHLQKSTLNLPQACDSLCLMAEVHCQNKRYKESISCYSEAQRIRQTIHGTYLHPEIAHILNQSGDVLSRQGEFDLAMEKHKEALRILRGCCGENSKNPLVSQTLIQIGNIYYKERNSLANIQCKNNDGYSTFIEGGMLEVIGRAHEDRGSYRMAIAFFEEKLQFLNDAENSNDLADVAETLNSLGMLSCRAGMYLEAIDYYDRALGIQMKLGCDDVQLAMARVLAGSVQYSLGHYQKSLMLFTNAFETLRGVGQAQETCASTLFYIGSVHFALCNYDDAMFNLRDALDIQNKLLGKNHPATLRTRREIANLFAIYESELEVAFDEYKDIIAAQKHVHGKNHPYVAETLHSIGVCQARKGDLPGALRSLEDCYNMRLQFLGMDHPQQATTLHEIAKIQLARGKLKKGIHIIDAALNIRVESLGDQHIDVALAMTTKASCLVVKGYFVDANKLFVESLKIARKALGPLHPSIACIHVQFGVMHLRKCDFLSASEEVNKALLIYRQSNFDEDHPGIKEATEELERVNRAEMLCV